MKTVLSFVLFVLVHLSLYAQTGIVKVTEGKVTEGQFYFDKVLVYDNFKEGRVTFSDGNFYTGPLNINVRTQSLRMISSEGDTILLNSEPNVVAVSAGRDMFRKINNYYLQLLNINNDVYLGLLRKMVIGKEMLEGAYGGVSQVASVSKMSSIEDGTRLDKYSGSSLMHYDYHEMIYLVRGNKTYPATKKNFIKYFPDQKREINEYIKQKGFSFANNHNVVELFNYLSMPK